MLSIGNKFDYTGLFFISIHKTRKNCMFKLLGIRATDGHQHPRKILNRIKIVIGETEKSVFQV